MQPYPHEYSVEASAAATGPVTLSSQGLPSLETAPPREFDGPGDRWSPETLLVGAVADCFTLSFRAIAAASRLSWTALRCRVEGRLDRAEGVARFTEMTLRVRLEIPPGVEVERARRLLEKSEKACLITNSLRLTPVLACEIETRGA